MTPDAAQIVYFSHGGGPLPILGDASHKAMIEFMQALPARLKKPEIILVISAHWEEREAALLGSAEPPMFYDYYGFPDEAYAINYPAPGDPAFAARVAGILERNMIPSRIDPDRGFDHGLFIPLKMMYPGAEIPAIQLSLLRGLDPTRHVSLGRALRELAHENILVIGSGFSFHNLRAFFAEDSPADDPANDAFQDWLTDVCVNVPSDAAREKAMAEWTKAPSARYCHPREEHLLPLHVCLGMADRRAEKIFDDRILGKRSLAFQW